MGFSIGRFLGGIAPLVGTAVGGYFGGAAGAAAGSQVGGAVQAGFTKVPGRVAAPGPQAPVNVFAQVPPLSSVVPTPSRLSFASLPSTTSLAQLPRAAQIAGGVLSLFGSDGQPKNRLQTILQSARAATGGPVTRNAIIDAARVCGLETAAATFGIGMEDVCFVVVRGKTRRRRGISAADIRRTKRTIRFVKGLRKDLVAVKGR